MTGDPQGVIRTAGRTSAGAVAPAPPSQARHPGVERGRRGPAVGAPAAAIVYEMRGPLPARALVRHGEAVRAAERPGGGPRCLLAGSPHG